MLTAASPSGFVEYKHILTELYKIYEQENECSTPHSSELEVPAWYSARRRRQKDEIGCIIQLIH